MLLASLTEYSNSNTNQTTQVRWETENLYKNDILGGWGGVWRCERLRTHWSSPLNMYSHFSVSHTVMGQGVWENFTPKYSNSWVSEQLCGSRVYGCGPESPYRQSASLYVWKEKATFKFVQNKSADQNATIYSMFCSSDIL